MYLLPFIYLLIVPNVIDSRKYLSVRDVARSPQDRWAYSARPWHYLIPDINHPILGDFALNLQHKIWNSKPYYLSEVFFPKEHTLYLGITLSILSLYAIYQYLIKPMMYRSNSKKFLIFNPLAELSSAYAGEAGSQFLKRRFYVKLFLVVAIISFIFSMPPYIGYNDFKI